MSQQNRTTLLGQSSSTFQDTPPANITPPNHRSFNTNCIDSFANLQDNNTFEGQNTFNGAVKVNNKLDTAYATVAAAATMNLGAVQANFIDITGNGVTITDFGTINQGPFRFILFSGSGTLEHGTKIQCPTQADIEYVTGDTCMVVSRGSGNWIVFNYQRYNGTSVQAYNYPWVYANVAPTINENVANGYLTNYRWIEGNQSKREFVLNDQTSGNWMAMGGTAGFAAYAGGEDIIFNGISSSFQDDGTAVSTITYDIRYHLVSDVFTIDGWIDIDHIALNNAHPNGDFFIDCTNDKNLNFFGGSTVTTAVGMGFARWNGAIAPHPYEILISGDSGTNELIIGIVTKNPHFGSSGTLRIYFTLTAGVTLL